MKDVKLVSSVTLHSTEIESQGGLENDIDEHDTGRFELNQ